MKNILMMHYDLMFYRIPFYNLLNERLKEKNYKLVIWFYNIQNEIDRDSMHFEYIDAKVTPMNMDNFKHVLNDTKIDKVINFLNPSQPSYLFYIKMLSYSLLNKIELIYYGHGINLEKQDSFISNQLYNVLHFFYKSIILYTPNEKKFLWNVHQKKTYVAYNTLCLNGYEELSKVDKKEIKEDLNFNSDDIIILFSGRIQERKKLNILLDIFYKLNKLNIKNIKLLIVGPGMTKEYDEIVQSNPLIVSLGPIYDKDKMSKIFYASDIFCIPGHIGLGLIEAMYWAIPVITMNVKHAPEIYYLEDSINGHMVEDENELLELIKGFSKDENIKELMQLSKNARNTYLTKGMPEMMVNGFIDAIGDK